MFLLFEVIVVVCVLLFVIMILSVCVFCIVLILFLMFSRREESKFRRMFVLRFASCFVLCECNLFCCFNLLKLLNFFCECFVFVIILRCLSLCLVLMFVLERERNLRKTVWIRIAVFLVESWWFNLGDGLCFIVLLFVSLCFMLLFLLFLKVLIVLSFDVFIVSSLFSFRGFRVVARIFLF